MTNSFLFSAVVAISIGLAAATYSYCGGSGDIGTLKSVSIAGCDNGAARCQLKRKTNVSIAIEFVPNQEIKEMKAVVHGIILDIPTPFVLPNPDACVDSGLVCPLTAGETYTYTAALPVKGAYPRVTVDVKWELVVGDEVVICALIPSKLV